MTTSRVPDNELLPLRIIRLTPPRISSQHIKEKVTCIRAHRERIFNVTTEWHQDKLLFHNYGQGGAGWTFLFGCVNESIRQFEQQVHENQSLRNMNIAVIGAGCYGLLTASMLAHKGYSVRIIAREIDDIASYKSAGFFFPRPRKSSTAQERAVFEAIGMESYRAYKQIVQGGHPFIKYGAKLLPCYFGLDIDPGFGPYIEQDLVACPERVTIDFGNGKRYDVMEYQTIFVDVIPLMHELRAAVVTMGIPITQAGVTSWEEIPETVIFNCAGLGAKTLTNDMRIVPVQGHLLTLRDQPAIEDLQYMINVKVVMLDPQGRPRDELIYFAPKESGILGITFIRGQDSLTANQHEFERLLQRCQEYFGAFSCDFS